MRTNTPNPQILLLVCALAAASLSGVAPESAAPHGRNPEITDPAITGEEIAVPTLAPLVPPPIRRSHATRVIVNLEPGEIVKRLSDGVVHRVSTFGGDVPAGFIRIREGDALQFRLHDHPSGTMPHGIELRAVTGPGGGGTSSIMASGLSSRFSFEALNPGLYIYQCTASPVEEHVANGMYGLILVEPKHGLPPVSREYYIMQGDFHTMGRSGGQGLPVSGLDKAVHHRSGGVRFQGAVASPAGDNALTASAGETVRLFVGNAGPNLLSSFHIVGETFDKVYPAGRTVAARRNVQTTLVPVGGTTIVEFKVELPGTYVFIGHPLFDAPANGAPGMLKVSPGENLPAHSGREVDMAYLGSGAVAGPEAEETVTGLRAQGKKTNQSAPQVSDLASSVQFVKGKGVYNQTCFVCHQLNGEGIPGQIPPLARSDYLMADKERSIRCVLFGQSGEITVNGRKYNGVMIPMNFLSDAEVANVLTYVRNSFGNSGSAVTPDEVRRIRNEAPARVMVSYE